MNADKALQGFLAHHHGATMRTKHEQLLAAIGVGSAFIGV